MFRSQGKPEDFRVQNSSIYGMVCMVCSVSIDQAVGVFRHANN